jgi:hypothetical protein
MSHKMHFYLLYKLELYTSDLLIRPHRPPPTPTPQGACPFNYRYFSLSKVNIKLSDFFLPKCMPL